MTADRLVRILAVALLGLAITVSARYRLRADRLGGKLPHEPGWRLAGLRILALTALMLSIGAPALPVTVRGWLVLPLPLLLRWVGIGMLAAAVPWLLWTLATLGTNISPTPTVRAGGSLVTGGPFSLVRHPLYSGGVLAFLGLAIALGSPLLLVLAAAMLVWLPRRARLEEANLTAAFGPQYREYAARTGRFVPRLF